jgi:putative redox protein
MKTTPLAFTNRSGHRLSARLDMPGSHQPSAYALFAHCFTCSKDIKAAHHISQSVASTGLAVLRFDFTGLGESQGDFADTSFSSNVDDLVDAARYLDDHYRPPSILIGHSLGGAAVLQAADRLPSVRAVAVIAAPADPSHVARHFGDSAAAIKEKGKAEVAIAGRTFSVKRRFLEDLEETRMQETIANLKRALIVFHGPRDTVVDIDNAARIFKAAKHPKSFISLDDADHLLSDPADSEYVGAVIAAWAKKYLGEPSTSKALLRK